MPTAKPTFGPTVPHAKFGTIKPQLLEKNCAIVKKICFFEEQTYVFGDDMGTLVGDFHLILAIISYGYVQIVFIGSEA